MTISIPGWLQWVSYIAGADGWPQGDEDALYDLGKIWEAGAHDVLELVDDLAGARTAAMSALEGEAAKEFDQQFQKIFGGDASAEKIAAVMKSLGETARSTGRDVEHTKLIIIGMLAIAAAQIIALLWSLWGSALVAAVVTAFRQGIMRAIVQLIEQIAARLAALAAKNTLKKLVVGKVAFKAAAGAAGKGLAGTAGKYAVGGAVLGGGMEFGIQAYQNGFGNRDGYDLKEIGLAAGTGLVGGAVMGAAGAPLRNALGKGVGGLATKLGATPGRAVSVGTRMAGGYSAAALGNAAGAVTPWAAASLGVPSSWMPEGASQLHLSAASIFGGATMGVMDVGPGVHGSEASAASTADGAGAGSSSSVHAASEQLTALSDGAHHGAKDFDAKIDVPGNGHTGSHTGVDVTSQPRADLSNQGVQQQAAPSGHPQPAAQQSGAAPTAPSQAAPASAQSTQSTTVPAPQQHSAGVTQHPSASGREAGIQAPARQPGLPAARAMDGAVTPEGSRAGERATGSETPGERVAARNDTTPGDSAPTEQRVQAREQGDGLGSERQGSDVVADDAVVIRDRDIDSTSDAVRGPESTTRPELENQATLTRDQTPVPRGDDSVRPQDSTQPSGSQHPVDHTSTGDRTGASNDHVNDVRAHTEEARRAWSEVEGAIQQQIVEQARQSGAPVGLGLLDGLPPWVRNAFNQHNLVEDMVVIYPAHGPMIREWAHAVDVGGSSARLLDHGGPPVEGGSHPVVRSGDPEGGRPSPIDAVMPVLDRYGVTLEQLVGWNELAATVGRDHLGEHFTPRQLQVMFEARMAHPHPDVGTPMQKVLDSNSVSPILKQIENPGSEYQGGGRYNANDTGGCMSTKADAAGLRTPAELLRGLRLDYGKTSPFNEFTTTDHAYVVEGRLAEGEVRVPIGRIAEQLGIDHPMVRDLATGDPPHTGTGYTGADKGLNPEYEVRNGKWEPGATLYRIDADGSRHPVARLEDGDTWVSVKDPADRVVEGWPKHEGTERVFRTPDEVQPDSGTGTHRQIDGENETAGGTGPPPAIEGPAAVRAFGESASETNAGASFFDHADATLRGTDQMVPRAPGEFTVDVHGNRDAVILRDGAGNEYRLSPREFADVIRTQTSWDGHTPIRLLSCDTGAGAHPFARDLARELGVEVTAPDRAVWAYPDGREPVVSSVDRGPGPQYELRPRIPPDGTWSRFLPDGRVEPVLSRGVHDGGASAPRSHPENLGGDDSAVQPHGREGADLDAPALLDLPDYTPGTLSNAETRAVYAHGELRMQELNKRWAAEGMLAEERAHRMFETRNELRQWARTLMADREAAAHLSANEKMMTWDRLVEKTEAKGFTGDEVFQEIIESSTRSRPGVNDALGIDPHNPPPLPPRHGADAEGRHPGPDDQTPTPRGGEDSPAETSQRRIDRIRELVNEFRENQGKPADFDSADAVRPTPHEAQDGLPPASDREPLFDGSDLSPAERQALRDVWEGLLPDERRFLYSVEPMFGEHAELPVAVSDRYARQAAHDLRDSLISDIEMRRNINGDPMITHHELAQLQFLDNLLESVKQHEGQPPRFLLGFEHDGRSITSVGNPDTATRTVVFAPGTFTSHHSLNPSLERPGLKNWFGFKERFEKPGYMEVSRRIHQALTNELRHSDVAVVDYQNYHAPQSLANPVTGAPNARFAHDGAAELRNHTDRLQHTNQVGDHQLWVAGHSYGTVLVGEAAKGGHGLNADGIINLGSPGLRVDDVSGLILKGEHQTPGDAPVHTMTRSDDPIRIVDKARQLHLDRFGIGHGLMPDHPEFGGRMWDVDGGPHRDPHNAYFDRDSVALHNIADIVAGGEPPPRLPQNEHGGEPGSGHHDSGRTGDDVIGHHDVPRDQDGRCAHDANDILTTLTGKHAELATEPSPTGIPAREVFEARESAAHFSSYEQVRSELLRNGDGATTLLVSKWAGDGGVGGHAYVARNDNGTVHLYEQIGDRIVRSGWPPHWGEPAVDKTAVGYFDRHGNPLDPLNGRHGELHTAEEIGDVAGRRRPSPAEVQAALRDAPRDEFGRPVDHRNERPLTPDDQHGRRTWVMRWDAREEHFVAENRSLEPPPPPDTFDPTKAVPYNSGDPYRPGEYLPDADPGWREINRGSSHQDWMDYQQQISGAARTATGVPEYMRVDADTGRPVEYDGHTQRGDEEVFLEAKDGYAGIAARDSSEHWADRAERLVLQAERQLGALPDNASLEWHVSDPLGAAAIRELLIDNGMADIVVIYTPKL